MRVVLLLMWGLPSIVWAQEETEGEQNQPQQDTEEAEAEKADEAAKKDEMTPNDEAKNSSEEDGVIEPVEEPKKSDKDGVIGPVDDPEDPEEDGVIGPMEEDGDESVFDKLTEVNEKFGLIFRPQIGLTTLSGNEETYAGYHAGLHVGYHKYYKLKLANIGWYTRTRGLMLPTFGEVNGSEMRFGSFVGVKLTAIEAETGIDILRHSMTVRGGHLDFAPDVGIAVPVKALIVFDDFKIKAGVEPRRYLGNARTSVDWEQQAFSTPLSGVIDEFSWNVGARVGLIGLSYDQLHMNGGVQRIISIGLQR